MTEEDILFSKTYCEALTPGPQTTGDHHVSQIRHRFAQYVLNSYVIPRTNRA